MRGGLLAWAASIDPVRTYNETRAEPPRQERWAAPGLKAVETLGIWPVGIARFGPYCSAPARKGIRAGAIAIPETQNKQQNGRIAKAPMNKLENMNEQEQHDEIDRIFKELLPAYGLKDYRARYKNHHLQLP